MDVDLDISGLDRTGRALASMLDENKMAAITKRSVKRAATAGHTELARQMRHQASIPVKITKRRSKIYFKDLARANAGAQGKIWIGLNAIAAQALGKTRNYGRTRTATGRKMPAGAAAGRHRFPGHFVINKYGGGIYRRTTSDRVPLELAKVEIEAAGLRAIRKASLRAEKQLIKTVQHELQRQIERSTS